MPPSGPPDGGGSPPDIPPELQKLLNSPSQEDILQVLHDDQVRSYRVDIETDSTIEADEQADRQSRTEFITAVGGFLQQALPVGQQLPELVPMIGEMLLFLVRGFAAGRQLEESIETAVSQLEQKAKMAASQPPPDPPEVVLERVKQEFAQQKMAADKETEQQKIAAEQAKSQAAQEIEDDKAQAEQARAQAEFDAERQDKNRELALKEKGHDLEVAKLGHAMQAHEDTMGMEGQKLQQAQAGQDQSMGLERDKLSQAKETGAADMSLKRAAHNKQLVEESAGEQSTDGAEPQPGVLQTLMDSMGLLAQAIAQGQQQMAASLAQSRQEARAEQLEDRQNLKALIAAMTAPKQMTVLRGPDGRVSGAQTVTH